MTDYKALYEQSQKDIEKLKNLIKILDQREEVKKLKEENKELKEKLEHKEDKIEDHLASCNFYEEQCQELKQEIKELDSYAKKHEQDNRILRFSTIGMTEEIDKLKEEIKEFKEKMDTICIELYARWNCSCGSPEEIIGDICGYDEDKHRELYYKKFPEDEEEDASIEHIARIIERTRISNEGLRWDNQDPGEVLEE